MRRLLITGTCFLETVTSIAGVVFRKVKTVWRKKTLGKCTMYFDDEFARWMLSEQVLVFSNSNQQNSSVLVLPFWLTISYHRDYFNVF